MAPPERSSLCGITEQIARYIIRYAGADATVLARRACSWRVQGADRYAPEALERTTVARSRRKRKVKTQRESAAIPKFLTIKELAAYLHVHRMTISRLLRKGQF